MFFKPTPKQKFDRASDGNNKFLQDNIVQQERAAFAVRRVFDNDTQYFSHLLDGCLGMGAASALTGLCLLLNPTARGSGLLGWVAPAGRQTLTLYIAHIVIGMGLLEALRLTENQSTATALFASLVFCAAAATFAWLWSRRFRRGPVEALMRRLAG